MIANRRRGNRAILANIFQQFIGTAIAFISTVTWEKQRMTRHLDFLGMNLASQKCFFKSIAQA